MKWRNFTTLLFCFFVCNLIFVEFVFSRYKYQFSSSTSLLSSQRLNINRSVYEKKNKIAQEISEYVTKYVENVQYPNDCTKAKFMKCFPLNACGGACTLHQVVVLFKLTDLYLKMIYCFLMAASSGNSKRIPIHWKQVL